MSDALGMARRVLVKVAEENGRFHGEAWAAIWAIDSEMDVEGIYDDRWMCDDCGGEWDSPDDDLVVGMRYLCVGCGEVTVADTVRPWQTDA